MAFWQTSGITDINEGNQPNDGTGDNIRDAFLKVDNNLGNISSFLSSVNIDFLNANIAYNFGARYANISNLFVANATGTISNFTGNARAGNLIANTGIYALGTSQFTGNMYTGNVIVYGELSLNSNTFVSNNIIPTANIQYDLGGPNNFFRNIYAQGLVQVTTVTANNEAGMLLLHSNLTPGETKDVGILGKFYPDGDSSNSYAYFGLQFNSSDFIYKISKTDFSSANSVAYDGVYGGAQFGGMLISNTTTATNTSSGALVVTGGAGIGGNLWVTQLYGNISPTIANITSMTVANVAGNLRVDGNIFSGGAPVITTDFIQYGTPFQPGAAVTGSVTFLSTVPSNSFLTGAVTIPNGGLGVGGNIVTGGGFYGTFYGNVSATSTTSNVGLFGNVTIPSPGSITASQINGTNMSTATMLATTSVQTPIITGLNSLTVGGNITAANVNLFANSALRGNVLAQVVTTGVLNATNTNGNAVFAAGNVYTANAIYTTTGVYWAGNSVPFGGINNGGVGPDGTSGYIQYNDGGYFGGANIVYAPTTGNMVVTSNTRSISTTTGAFISTGGIGITNGNLYIGGSNGNAIIATGSIWNTGSIISSSNTQATSTTTGVLRVTGGASINTGNLYIGGSGGNALVATGNIYSTTVYTTSGVFWAGNNASFSNPPGGTNSQIQYNNNLLFDGASNFTYNNLSGNIVIGTTTPSTTTSTGALVVGGGVGIAGVLNITNTGDVSANIGSLSNSQSAFYTYANTKIGTNTNSNLVVVSTTPSTSTTTGALVVGGGAGFSGNIYTSGWILPSANVSQNLGSSTQWWNTFYGVSSQAQYADLAERYVSDADYEPGTVVVFGGVEEITVTNIHGDTRVAGIVSTDPAYLMNASESGLPIALRGKVPTKVIGAVKKGDLLVASNTPGYAVSVGTVDLGNSVIAKSLEDNNDPGKKIIIAVVI